MISDKTKMVFLVIAGCVLFLTACGKEEEENTAKEVVRPIKMMTVTSGTDAVQLKFPGMVRAAKRADLAFLRVQGRLSRLREGMQVSDLSKIGGYKP